MSTASRIDDRPRALQRRARERHPVPRGARLRRRAARPLRAAPPGAAGRPPRARRRSSRRGGTLDFLEETREIREGDWQVAAPADDYLDRRVEITGPTDRKLVINALNSGAKGFMADFEDATAPTWENVVVGHVNLIDAIDRTITYDASDGKHYELAEETATLLVRPRGWHLNDKHVRSRAPRSPAACSTSASTSSTTPSACSTPARGRTSTCPRWSTTSRRGCGTTSSPSPRRPLGVPHGTIARDRADRDAARRVPDGRDPLRAARALLRPQRRPLGLHLLDDQVLPRPRGLRAARPQRREDDGPVHEGLHGAAGQDLPRPRRLRDGRHGGADPLAQGRGGQPARDRRGARGQGARGQGRLRRHLGRAPGRRRRRARGVRRRPRRQAQPDRQAARRRRGDRRRPARRRLRPRATSPRRACATTSPSASSTSRSGSAAAAPRGSTT